VCTALLLKLEVCTPVCVCVCVCVCVLLKLEVYTALLVTSPSYPTCVPMWVFRCVFLCGCSDVCSYVGVPMCVPKCARGVNGSLGHQPQFPWFS